MKVFISSTSEDLKDYRSVVQQLVLEAQWQPVGMEHFPSDPRPIVQLCRETLSSCDLVILLQAFRRGWVPKTHQGGDGETSITCWEIKAAEERGTPVLAFLANDHWPGHLWEHEPERLAWIRDFRDGLNRAAKFFQWEDSPHRQFRAIVRESLAIYRERLASLERPAIPPVSLRQEDGDSAALPDEPYPLLGPYQHSKTFAGRDFEIERLCTLVRREPLVLCLHSPSGAGKSSLLLAGLAPRLRQEGYAVSVERAPGDPGLADRLIADILTLDSAYLQDNNGQLPLQFARLIAHACALSRKRVILVLDQIDDVLRNPATRQALASIGPLLAATAQRRPGALGFACKWILCYRHEFHGVVRAWLEDVLAPARASNVKGLDLLPSDLSDTQKSHEWAIPVFGTVLTGNGSPDGLQHAFLRAIQQPLALHEDGRPRYRYVISPDGAQRLASMFSQLRRDRPDAALVPELQVVLHDLLQSAVKNASDQTDSQIVVDVPDGEELSKRVRHALREHVEHALDRAFPPWLDAASGRQVRTRALLALGQLADPTGKRSEGIRQNDLARMIGAEGDAVLTKLAAADNRLVVVNNKGLVELSHDCLAEAVMEIVTSDAARDRLALDRAIIDLNRTISQKVDLYLNDPEDASSTSLSRQQREVIRQNNDTLLFDQSRRDWWTACTNRHLTRRRRYLQLAAGLAVAIIGLVIYEVNRWGNQALVLDLLRRAPDDQTAFTNLAARAESPDWERVLGNLGDTFVQQQKPSVLSVGPWLADEFAPPRLLDVVERAYRLLVPSRELFGAMIFSVEETWLRSSSEPEVRRRAETLLSQVREAFVNYHLKSTKDFRQPPPTPGQDHRQNPMIRIRGGRFVMGSSTGLPDERPAHAVNIPEFEIQQHEVTNLEYRRFNPSHQFDAGHERHPVTSVTWYEAMAYAAWLGGTLPTEAQWEFAARGTSPSTRRRYPWGNETPDRTRAVHAEPTTSVVGSRPAGRTPEGLDDMAGNVWEWCRDWYGPYRTEDSRDPLGPTPSKSEKSPRRTRRGGAFNLDVGYQHSTYRSRLSPDARSSNTGFRVVSSGVRR